MSEEARVQQPHGAILWRRLDTPGHDACRLNRTDQGWSVEGAAVFLHHGAPARVAYRVECDHDWLTRAGRVSGWIGTRPLDLRVARTVAGVWTLDDATVPGLDTCVDFDLGFTPATNLIPLRRLALADGQAADATAAWLDVSAGALTALPQRYARRTRTAYWYEAPTVGYAALLEVTPDGFVRRYPGLWEAEPRDGSTEPV